MCGVESTFTSELVWSACTSTDRLGTPGRTVLQLGRGGPDEAGQEAAQLRPGCSRLKELTRPVSEPIGMYPVPSDVLYGTAACAETPNWFSSGGSPPG